MPDDGSQDQSQKWVRIRQQIDQLFLPVDAALEECRNAKPEGLPASLETLSEQLDILGDEILRTWGSRRDKHVQLQRAHTELKTKLRQTEAEREEAAVRVDQAEAEREEAAVHVDLLTQKLEEYRAQVQGALEAADEEIAGQAAYIADLEALIQPPRPYGTFVRANEDGTVDLMLDGRRISATTADDVDLDGLRPGQRLLLTPQGNVLQALDEFEDRGEEGVVDELLSDGRVRVTIRNGENVVAFRSENLGEQDALVVGDHVLFEGRSGYVLEVLPRKATSDLMLEEIPDLTFADIGGQDAALEKLRDHIELPLLHPDRFGRYALPMGAGLLLYGPPGVGKTLALKVVANTIRKTTGRPVSLLYVAGPQLLTMWVGETERKIREPFELAKQKAGEEGIVILLFDEIDAMFPTRGTRIGTSGVGETAVTQFSTMLDGVTEYGNIMVIGTSNRPDMIDPALTRPGRLYPPVEFPRPDRDGVANIFGVYLRKDNFPFHPKYGDPRHAEFDSLVYKGFPDDRQKIAAYVVNRLVERIFGDPKAPAREREAALRRQRVVAIEYQDTLGGITTFYMKDIISGALIKAMVDRGKQLAIKDEIAQGEDGGLRLSHLFTALEEIFAEGEALPNRTDAREWARVLNLPESRPFRVLPQGSRDAEDRLARRRGRSAT